LSWANKIFIDKNINTKKQRRKTLPIYFSKLYLNICLLLLSLQKNHRRIHIYLF
jgi:hypothetical protein